jgi:hypothetical protein
MEKKPLFHFLPGSPVFSVATAGCNLHCRFCQNWQISQRPPEETHNYDLPPDKLVAAAEKNGCCWIPPPSTCRLPTSILYRGPLLYSCLPSTTTGWWRTG